MEDVYEYRTIRIERGAWPRVAAAVHGEVNDRVASVGGIVFGLFRGEIGWYADEGALMTAWPSGADPARARLDSIPEVLESAVERLVATVRPSRPEPVTEDGVWAHRWFDLRSDDWPEFLDLSHGAWPHFEAAFEGTRVAGFWRSKDEPDGMARVLLLTRYASLDAWERSRPYAAVRVEAADQARERFVRRAELTQRTIVRISRLA